MSEKARPVCGHCMREIAKSETGVRHYGLHSAHAEHRCIYILDAEITALRAALDQERADNARLREYAQHTGAWCGQNMGHACTCGLDALLSGRGEGGNDG